MQILCIIHIFTQICLTYYVYSNVIASVRQATTRIPPALQELLRDFWHNCLRTSGDVKTVRSEGHWKGSEKHQVHYLDGTYDSAYVKFLQWPEYINYKERMKEEQGEDWIEKELVGRTVFLESRCFCVEQVIAMDRDRST
jgi:hypothetical protein